MKKTVHCKEKRPKQPSCDLEDKGIGLQGLVANKLRAKGNTDPFGAYGKTK
jgi:hypothetical protein